MAKEPVLAPKVTTWINVELLTEPVIPGNVEAPVVEDVAASE